MIIIDWNGKARQEALAVFTLYADHPPLKGYKYDNPSKTGDPPFKKAMLAVNFVLEEYGMRPYPYVCSLNNPIYKDNPSNLKNAIKMN